MNGLFTIEGFGRYVPERVLTNQDLESMVETNDEWIVSRTGIKERHLAAPGEAVSDMALMAAKAALADAGKTAEDLSHVYVCTLTPDTYCPPSACYLEEKLGIRGRTAMDINAACSGFLYGLEASMGCLCLRPEAKVLMVAAESLSSRTNWADRSTCVLFGDGAGAVVMSTAEPKAGQATITDVILKSDGSLADLLTVKGGGSAWPMRLGEVVGGNFFVQMAGPEVFKIAVRSMGSVCEEILAKNNLTPADVDLFVPHQANLRIIEAVGKRLGMDNSRVMVTIHRYGNTSASSIGIALAEARIEGRIAPGANVLLASFGGGFTWGAVLLRFA